MKTTEVRPIEILLVEDSPSDAEFTVEAIRAARVCHHLNIVEDGVQAMGFLRRQGRYAQAARPNLIMLDLNLPRKDGREVLAELKADDRFKTIPVVVLTTSRAEEDVLRAYQLHANGYMTKPVDGRQFLDMVQSLDFAGRNAPAGLPPVPAVRDGESHEPHPNPGPVPLKILLVEDSPSDAALLQESLAQTAQEQLEFTHADCWEQAVKNLQAGHFDVMLLDLSLSDSTGRDTFLRARAEAPHLPIVVLTGVEDEVISLDAVRHGIQDYLVKDQAYGRQTVRAIRHAIERKRLEEALQKIQAELEKRVQDRTAELSQVNRVLQAEIAQREQAKKARLQVLQRLADAEETERSRISRELHDRLGQDLTGLKLGIQLVRQQGPFAPPVQESLGRLEQIADGLMRDIHRLAWELHPAALDDLGLEMVLRHYLADWSKNSQVPMDFHSEGMETRRLPLPLETMLYRITQEALTNVTRHANAKRVSVLLERRPDLVSLIVEDDGSGFDASIPASAAQGKLGLLGMRERVTLAGGTLEIESTPGAGTTLFVRVPLKPKPAAG
jgi:CheY-like chemotaxis protein/anti-sigma regulatory factor (Ser/Thr protein kinase)